MKNRIKNMQLYSTFANSSWILIEKIISLIVGMVTSALVARYFGTEVFGLFSYSNSLVSLFTVIATLGLETIVVKEIVGRKNQEGEILCSSLFLRFCGSLLLLVLAYASVSILKPDSDVLKKLVLVLSLQMIFKSTEIFEYWTQAYQKAKYVSIVRFAGYILTSLLKLYVVFGKRTIVDYAFVFVIDALFFGVMMFIVYIKYRTNISDWKINPQIMRMVLKQSKYLIISGLMSTIYTKIDQLMLGSMMDTTSTLGVYSVAVMLANLWIFVPNSIIVSFKPVIMKEYNSGDGERYKNSFCQMYSVLIWMGIICSVMITLFGRYFVILLYGKEYILAGSYLCILIWGTLFGIIGCGVSLALICENKLKYNVILVAVGVLVNIILNLILIPIFEGFGAAIATLATQALSNFIILLFIPELRNTAEIIVKSINPRYLFSIFKGGENS